MKRRERSTERWGRRASGAALLVIALLTGMVLTAGPASAAMPICNTTVNYMTNPDTVPMPGYANGGNIDAFNCYLKRGNNDHGLGPIATLQTALNLCYGRSLTVDGSYGAQTEGAVKFAQRTEELKLDGVFGPETRWHMKWPVYREWVFVGCWQRWA